MATILVTGSSDGIGLQTARTLIEAGHRVILHARSESRAEGLPSEAAGVVIGDLTSLDETKALAAAAGACDVVIHNAGVGGGQSEPVLTGDGVERIFQVNVLAPYVLTALVPWPARLVYLTSGLQSGGEVHFDDLSWRSRRWDGMQAYSDSKLYDVMLAFAVARRRPGTLSNTVDPGWIRTRMGGAGATGELSEGADTPIWLATSDEPAAKVTGRYFNRRQELRANPLAYREDLQEELLAACAELSGVKLPD
ncbi:SDR family NAD(P)-dependent oxidoreductase [Actinoplanes friuliensis]|jgi:NAD(P)-dependent dehydrogenase (short-subunit alcohol dehydrogenase family)|uniref:Short-chain dehydrogenase/reductase SDR n=1 Tax=Actinoplanes friuliensis DSM 7358 TaxID=1246995 RepID=U5W1R4_9ACTN|nr:SDR family NAD(P)-dependent oxidoreductase [Actinoplanes friuliensis]AGZ41930.1 short-chain dehydrogenase/reductase SDR [Actinoplanes friuliensis DSM 7358]